MAGDTGIKVDASQGGTFNVALAGVRFFSNGTGFLAKASNGGTLNVSLVDCAIRDDREVGYLPGQGPGYVNPSRGLAFEAREANDAPGVVNAEIVNFMPVGDFLDMTRIPLSSSTADLYVPFQAATRLIDISARGTTAEHVDPPNNNFSRRRIAEVNVEIQGGVWHAGKTGPEVVQGWDIGVFAENKEQNGSAFDYRYGYTVKLTGVELDSFGLAGIYATSFTDSRGQLFLNGGTSIRRTGYQGQPVPGSFLHSGIHLYNVEGYLALHGRDFESSENLGCGVFLNSPGTRIIDPFLPFGTYLDLMRRNFHENSGSGIRLRGGKPWVNLPSFRQGVVIGGTWDNWGTSASGGNKSFINFGWEPFGNPLTGGVAFGQGRINRCAVSNNGEFGLQVEVDGNEHEPSAASVRLVNSYLWNNQKGEV